MKAIYNSREILTDEIVLHDNNRAFCYGDGLFETIVTGPNRINLLHYHWARLTEACGILKLQLPFSMPELTEMLERLTAVNNLSGDIRFRLQVWRDSGGLYAPEKETASFLLTAAQSQRPFYTALNRLGLSRQASVTYHSLSFAKTMSAMPYVLAGIEQKSSDFDDLIITNGAGHVSECIISNIFWYREGCFFTPELGSGCVEGTLRNYLLDQMRITKTPVEEVLVTAQTLHDVQSIFLTNAAGVQWVRHYEDKALEDPKEKLKPLLKPLRLL